MPQSLIGQSIGNRYRLTQHLSEGGYGNVFNAVDTQMDDQVVAVKLLRPPPPGMDADYYNQLQQRFMDEARVSALLGEHPYIVQVKSYGIYQDQLYLVMEHLNAPPLSGKGLDYVSRKEGIIAPDRAVHLASQICVGLQFAHRFEVNLGKHSIRGVIHRDIKPSNIFVIRDKAQNESIKILDFGISKLISESPRGLTQTGYFLGTMCYASPEQLRGESLDARSDIYSLGVMLYELLTGCLPLAPETDSLPGWYHVHNFQKPRAFQELLVPQPIPEQLQRVILTCLEKEPVSRPASMELLAEQLLAAMPQSDPSPLKPAARTIPLPPEPILGRVNAAKTNAELRQATQMIEQGQHRSAVHLLNHMISVEPNEAEYYLQRAIAHQKQGNWGMSQMDYQGVLRLDPDNLAAQTGLQAVLSKQDSTLPDSLLPEPIPDPSQPEPETVQAINTSSLAATKGLWLNAWVWILANGAGTGVGYLGAQLLLSQLTEGIPFWVYVIGAGCWLGACIGLAQMAAMQGRIQRLRVRDSGVWIGLTTLAYGLGSLALGLLITVSDSLLTPAVWIGAGILSIGILQGAALGLGQKFLWRGLPRAWILSNGLELGMGAAIVVGAGLLNQDSALSPLWLLDLGFGSGVSSLSLPIPAKLWSFGLGILCQSRVLSGLSLARSPLSDRPTVEK